MSFEVVLLGDPVAHSVSPAMHNAAFRSLGLPGHYSARQVARERLADVVAELRHNEYRGANVTVPHKEAALPLMDELGADAEAIGAVNTIVRDSARLRGENTDATGLLAALEETLGAVPYGQRILLLGAGGAARAAAAALLSHGPASLTIYNRDTARAERLTEALRARYGGRVRAAGLDAVRAEGADVDLIVNATSAGLDGATLPLTGLRPRPGAALYDMVYRPSPTPLMRDLAARGTRVADGLAMLVAQAAASFALWTGQPAPLDVMRAAARRALAAPDPSGSTLVDGHIVLIGLSGSGKSSVGAALAAALGRPFYDTDALLAARAGQAVPDLLRADPARFRALEEQVVAEACAAPPGVIATGGGVVLSPRNRETLRQDNHVVWLRAPVSTLVARLNGGEERPLLAGDAVARLAALATEREAWYDGCATVVIDTGGLTVEESVARVRAAVVAAADAYKTGGARV